MKIIILANSDIGLYRFRKELIAELVKDNEVSIALPYGKYVDELKTIGCSFVNIDIDRRGVNPLRDIRLIRDYNKLFLELKPDYVIAYTIKPNIYGGYVCRRRKIKYSVNITGLGTAFEKGIVLKTFVENMYRFSLKYAKSVLFENSANMNLFLSERIIKPEQAHLLNGAGVNLNVFKYEEYPNNQKVRFLFIGRVMKEKGIDELLIATKRLVNDGNDCCLDIVGPFEENYQEQFEKYEKEGWLSYLGYQDDVRPYIIRCDCFVLPSYHEGMANTNLECAASGRPIITTNIPGCREAVIDGESGYLCEPKNADSLYSAMRKMMKTDKRSVMGMCGRRLMENRFDKKMIVDKTMTFLF